jgi:hypothetical protein
MAGELTTTINFADGDQVTSAKLNEIISGASFTTSAITGTTLSVTGGKMKVGTITSSELGVGCVTATAIAANAVTSTRILNGNVTTEKIADSAVTAAKIADGAITFAKLATAAAATKTVMQSETAGYVVIPSMVKHADGAAKAHGCFSMAAGTRTLLSYNENIASATYLSSTTTRVTFDNAMIDAYYTVLATWESNSAADNQTVSIFNKNATYFEIKHATEASLRRINFIVFGRLA